MVHAAFTTDVDSDEPAEWIIGRDVLIDGLEGPAGEGDVRIWPAGEEGRRDLYILLNPPSGTALLKAPAQEVNAFLQETEAVVPRGGRARPQRLRPLAGTPPRRRVSPGMVRPEAGTRTSAPRCSPPW
ncbi:SsgA family sporulation/cell division regulator [Streptomyces sp. NPDC046881]|uniref:SsgA family sporulation/cell division regulator n=1 Tax=Streptomyces sp. NPDC046881 TaxID=3155374 RepID=UPI0033CBF376